MLNVGKSLKSRVAAALVAITAFSAIAPAAAQDRDGRRGERSDNRGGQRGDNNRGDNNRADNNNRGGRGDWGGRVDRNDRDDRRDNRNARYNGRFEWRGDRNWNRPQRAVVYRPRPSYYRPHYVPRARYYNRIYVNRAYGHAYPGFGFYYRDTDAMRFLGLTALSLAVFSQLNEYQQRAHEEAFVHATAADIGEPIYWNEGGRSGRVTAVRDGMTTDGRQCREFQQEVTIGGNRTEAYGTACLQPDGSWEVVND